MTDLTVDPQSAEAAQRPSGLHDPSLYLNREESWLAFNDRVLQLAEDESVALLERLKFCAIWSANLDEFVMVRAAGLHDQIDAGIDKPGEDGSTPSEQIDRIRAAIRDQQPRVCRALGKEILPELAERGIRIAHVRDVGADARRELDDRFRRQIFPVLTPLAVGPGRPFPYISNLSLSLAVRVHDPETEQTTFARVKVPKEVLPRFLRLDDGRTMVPLEEVIEANLDQLFPGMEILCTAAFRVTRDADFTVSDEADDLLQAVEAELRRRRFGEVVRVEVEAGIHPHLLAELSAALDVGEEDVFEVDGLLDLGDLWDVYGIHGHDDLRDPVWAPVTQPRLHGEDGAVDVLAAMREGDILVHHPYDSFSSSVESLIEQAVADPDVLAIKLTVYRTSEDTPLIPALIRASERGKQVVCLVELKARFDERANIQWARELEEAGIHVVHGLPALKTHAKCMLIVRREGDGIRHYVHVGTGNYNPTTARIYTDFGLFTCDPDIGADVADMFNVLTGFARPHAYRRVLVAPDRLRDGIIEEIERTIEAHREGKRSRISLKMNALVDGRCIRALYRASQAGVPVDCNVRGICCLKPGIPGVSENIQVVSVVGRFLEHSRIFAFERGEEQAVWIGSADLMPRNLDTRVELMAPVGAPALREELLDTLERCLSDNTNAWELDAHGTWHRRASAGEAVRNAQDELMARHAARAQESAD